MRAAFNLDCRAVCVYHLRLPARKRNIHEQIEIARKARLCAIRTLAKRTRCSLLLAIKRHLTTRPLFAPVFSHRLLLSLLFVLVVSVSRAPFSNAIFVVAARLRDSLAHTQAVFFAPPIRDRFLPLAHCMCMLSLAAHERFSAKSTRRYVAKEREVHELCMKNKSKLDVPPFVSFETFDVEARAYIHVRE